MRRTSQTSKTPNDRDSTIVRSLVAQINNTTKVQQTISNQKLAKERTTGNGFKKKDSGSLVS